MVEIWESKTTKENRELPIIIPLVIYHGKTDWRTPSNLGAMLNGYDQLSEELKAFVPNFNYVLYDVSIFTDEEIKGETQLRILLTLLRDIFTKDPKELQESILKALHYLTELEDKQTGLEYLNTMMHYIFGVDTSLSESEKDEIIRGIDTIYPEGRELTMSFIDKWREEGIEKGIEKGKVDALSEVAVNQLTERFGELPLEIKDGIANADTVALQLLLSNIFRYESIDDVRRYI